MKPVMTRETMEPYDLHQVSYIKNVDHNESLSVGPGGEAYTCGFITGNVFRLNLETGSGESFGGVGARVLGQVVDADGNLYCAEPEGPQSKITRITPQGETSVYSTGPREIGFLSANTPAFDRQGFTEVRINDISLG